jgi:hypothetical protein
MDHKLEISGTHSLAGSEFNFVWQLADPTRRCSLLFFLPVTSHHPIQFRRPTTFNIHVRGYRYVPLSIDAISVLRTVFDMRT